MTQADKAAIFQRLHEGPSAFVIPNPWDAGSAFLLETLGFKALATTSAGLAFSLARPDGAVSREEALANAAAIVNATSLPVAADLENGYGPSPEACALTITRAGAAGLVGGSIEDATGEAQSPIFDVGLAVERVTAAVEAARKLGFPFMLTARAENFLHGRADLKDTVKRLQAFQQAGADVLFAPGLRTREDIRAVTSSVDRPVNVMMGLQGVRFSVNDLASLGVRRISIGSALARAAYGAMLKGAREIAGRGTFSFSDDAVPFGEVNAIFAKARP
ncbi:MAG: isocitrate lyase/phosphoenolpyruvate mutase family protein [Rhizobiales bacterium]|nr:isocitrate lyase/phosphoenolpyruvate mutase family protein [Hyphomicrobiales bacterium]MBI3673844.1 isocitrate lyase/phosphoenolpyruvate mutase family protein [Hyphomicrobiales bacterium]